VQYGGREIAYRSRAPSGPQIAVAALTTCEAIGFFFLSPLPTSSRRGVVSYAVALRGVELPGGAGL